MKVVVSEPGGDGIARAGTGFFGETLRLDVIQDIVRQTRLGTSGYAYAVDDRGTLIEHPSTPLLLVSTPGDESPGLVEHRIDRRPEPPGRKGADRLGDRRAGRLEGVRRAARERRLRPPARKDLEDSTADRRLRPCRRRALHPSCPPPGAPDQAPAGGGRGDRGRRLRRAHRPRPAGRARCTGDGLQHDGRPRAGADRRPGAQGGRAHEGARGGEQAQVRVPGQHEPRAAHAAERDHRLHPGAAAEAVRRGERQAGGVPGGHPRLRQPPARPDQRRARPVQGGSGAGGTGSGRLLPAGSAGARGGDGQGARRQERSGTQLQPDPEIELVEGTSAASARSCSTCSRTRSSSRPREEAWRSAPPSETAKCWSR